MDGLEQTYSSRIEFLRYDLGTEAGWCEFQRQQAAGAITSTNIPSMMYFDATGKLVDTSNRLMNQAELQGKLDRLLGTG